MAPVFILWRSVRHARRVEPRISLRDSPKSRPSRGAALARATNEEISQGSVAASAAFMPQPDGYGSV